MSLCSRREHSGKILTRRTLRQEANFLRYTLGELGAGALAGGKRQHIVRPIHKNPDGSCFHDHKGFNWMVLRETLAQRFEIERMLSSPLTWLTPHLASQVWFLLQQKVARLPA